MRRRTWDTAICDARFRNWLIERIAGPTLQPKPYHQAHARGVRIIDATAHYGTTDLDEGPIIEQETWRINHGFSADHLVEVGQEWKPACWPAR